MNAPSDAPRPPQPPAGPVPGSVRAQQAFLYLFGAVTLTVLVVFTAWLIYAVGGVWWTRLTGG